MPIYKALRSFASVSSSPRKGQEVHFSQADGDSLVRAGYVEFVKDDPVPFDEWALGIINSAPLKGPDGLLDYAKYFDIPLEGASKKDDVLAKVVAWFEAGNADEGDEA